MIKNVEPNCLNVMKVSMYRLHKPREISFGQKREGPSKCLIDI